MQKEITIDGKIYPVSQKDRMTASVLYTAKKENLKLNELLNKCSLNEIS